MPFDPVSSTVDRLFVSPPNSHAEDLPRNGMVFGGGDFWGLPDPEGRALVNGISVLTGRDVREMPCPGHQGPREKAALPPDTSTSFLDLPSPEL